MKSYYFYVGFLALYLRHKKLENNIKKQLFPELLKETFFSLAPYAMFSVVHFVI